MCGQEVAHAVANKKRIVTILYHKVDYNELLPGLKEIQWINYPELGFEHTFQRLITAIDTDLDWVRSHTRVLVRALEWDRNERDNSFLLRGMDLQNAIEWLAQAPTIKEPKLLPLQEEHIRASQKREAEELEHAQRRERVANLARACRLRAEQLGGRPGAQHPARDARGGSVLVAQPDHAS